ncbi:MAG: ABC transporter permease [Armatimonadota bacterium]
MSTVLALLKPVFLTWGNLSNVFQQIATNTVLACGMTFVIATGGIDLSVGSTLALCGVVMGDLVHRDVPVALSVLVGLLCGSAVGALNGVCISVGSVPPFVATLGAMSALRGTAFLYTDGANITIFPETFTYVGGGYLRLGRVPIPVSGVVALTAVLIGQLVMARTALGRYMQAIGANEQAVRLAGIPLWKYKTLAYAVCGFTAAVGGWLVAARLNSAQPRAGIGYELDAIAAAVIGGNSLSGGRGSLVATLAGALIIGVLRNGLNLSNVSSFVQEIVIGCVIVVSVMVDQLRRTR